MPYLLVRLTVEDFAKWKPFFDQFGATRKAYGSRGYQLFRSESNPNELTVLYEWDSLDNARQFAQSSDLREIMQRAGVIPQPDFSFLESIETGTQ